MAPRGAAALPSAASASQQPNPQTGRVGSNFLNARPHPYVEYSSSFRVYNDAGGQQLPGHRAPPSAVSYPSTLVEALAVLCRDARSASHGHRVLRAEIDEDAVEVAQHAFRRAKCLGDVLHVDPAQVRPWLATKCFAAVLVCGGSPCQDVSQLKVRTARDAVTAYTYTPSLRHARDS